MTNKIKAGIVGYGYMGKIRKMIIDEHPDLDLSGICEVNKDLVQGVPCQLFDSYAELLKSGIDMIFVCTPNSSSPEIVIESLKQDKHVFCEKPPGRTLQDIQMMVKAEKEHPEAKLMFGFNHRYHPGILEAKTIVDSGRLGKILYLKGTYGKSGGKNYLQSWRNNKEISGGGILLDQGIHMLDLFRLFCGDFQEVRGFLSKTFWNTDVEDNAFVSLRNTAGQVAILHSSATQWKHTFRLEIYLEGGYLIVTGLLSKTGSYGRETLTIGRRQFEDESFALGNPREEVIYFDQDLSWTQEVDKFVDCVLKNKKIDCSSSNDALRVMEIVDTIYREEEIKPSIQLKGKEAKADEKCSI
ncbi:MAG: Gfo/Idh/MocA family oxidoreductase [Pseudomonadota bacterium]